MEWISKLNQDYELTKSRTNTGENAVLAASSANWLWALGNVRTAIMASL